MLIPAVLRLASHPIAKSDRAERTVAVTRTRNVGDSTGQEQQEASLANPFAHIGSPHGRAAVVELGHRARNLARDSVPPEAHDPSPTPEHRPTSSGLGSQQLPEEERQEVEQLRQRDREVRAHEQAHKSAGGAHAGAIHLEHRVGPDGKRYATSGSVPIDVSPVPGDPEATLRKMEIVRKAALAPAEPSGADRQVASQASQTARQARAQLAASRYESARGLASTQQGAGAQTGAAGGSPSRATAAPASEASLDPSTRSTGLGVSHTAARRRVGNEPLFTSSAPRTLGLNLARYEGAQQLGQTGRAPFFSHIG